MLEALRRHRRVRADRAYAAIGDGRTVALVARDGSIDWLPLPELDSPSVFGAVLDAERGGRFALAPEVPVRGRAPLPAGHERPRDDVHDRRRRGARHRRDDACPAAGSGPLRELLATRRGPGGPRADGVERRAALRLRRRPRRGSVGARASPVATAGRRRARRLLLRRGRRPRLAGGAIRGRFEAREGTRALIALCAAHHEPLVFPARDELEARLDATVATWRRLDRRPAPTRARGARR